MQGLNVIMNISGGELEQIMRELAEAQEKIYDCYRRLGSLGFLTIEETTSGN